MSVWDFADKHAVAFVLCVMFSAWGLSASVNGILRVVFKTVSSKETEK